MDQELLAQARRAGDRLIEAEHDADIARADFYRAVRRLHLNGASLRELASELALSHQRVHQIVEAAGGARRWRVRHDQAAGLTCSFCGLAQRRTRALVTGPGVCICDKCIKRAGTVIASGRAAQTPRGPLSAVPEDVAGRRCSFCGKHRHQVSGLATTTGNPAGKIGDDAAICAECLTLCQDIRTEQLTSSTHRPEP
ncbi:MAG: ClpX C4-type zinc finger protein [Actinomycetota bacterium]